MWHQGAIRVDLCELALQPWLHPQTAQRIPGHLFVVVFFQHEWWHLLRIWRTFKLRSCSYLIFHPLWYLVQLVALWLTTFWIGPVNRIWRLRLPEETQCSANVKHMRYSREESLSSFHLLPLLLFLPICVLLFKQNTFSIFSILPYLCFCQVTPSISKALWAPTQISLQTHKLVCVCVYVYVFMCCCEHFMDFRLQVQVSLSDFRWYTTCLLTNNGWINRHVFIRHSIQQAENWPEYLPAPPILLLRECRPRSSDCFWQGQQEQAAWKDFQKTTSCICAEKSEECAKSNKKLLFSLNSFADFWNL